MFDYTWQIIIAIVLFFGFCLISYGLINKDNFQYRLSVELNNLFKIETEVSKGQGK